MMHATDHREETALPVNPATRLRWVTYTPGRCARAALVALAVLFGACASSPPLEPEPLPFHVALVPLDTVEVRAVSSGLEGQPTGMQLAVDPAVLSQLIAESLEAQAGFSRATLLVQGGPLASAAMDEVERERMWIDRAGAVQADLILVCDVSLSPTVHQEANSRFWLNFPLYLLGGPFAWFVRDRTYYMDARLDAVFYAPELLNTDGGRLTDPFARVASVNAYFGELDQNFITRAHGGLGRYALSAIIPAGFLAKESEAMAASLSLATQDSLCRTLAEGVQGDRDDLLRGDDLATPFYLDATQLTLESRADGSLVLRGVVELEVLSEVTQMDLLRVLFSDGEGLALSHPPVEHEFDAGEDVDGGRRRRFAFETQVVPPPGARLLRIEIEAGQREILRRRYTLAMPEVGISAPEPPSGTAEADRSAQPDAGTTSAPRGSR